jgi:hypothetical protein
MKEISWSFITSVEQFIDHPECVRPLLDPNYNPFKSVAKESVAKRKGAVFLKCPAHTDFMKNTFVFCAPFDITIDINIDKENKKFNIFCSNISQEIFDQIIDTRFLHDRGTNPYPVIGIDWLTVFTAEDSIQMQVTPAFMHYNDFTDKTTVIPGEFDISKWTRPVELVFEIKKSQETISIKKGDAISYIKFLSNDHVKLVHAKTPWEEIVKCNNLRTENKYRPLTERYNDLEKIRQAECPYNHK